MQDRYILALDQGTTSSRAIIVGYNGEFIHSVSQEFKQIYPQPGWVEHDPNEIWQSQKAVAEQVIVESGIGPEQLAAIGITNQRETTILWEKATGLPVYNAIVWQCRRTTPICSALKEEGFDQEIHQRTGLICDAYFSATKIRWLLDHVPGLRSRARKGEIVFGTVDSWLLHKLTGGTVHATDETNASRTMLYNIYERQWDSKILNKLEIPEEILPQVSPSSHIFGTTAPGVLEAGLEIPISGIAGDQQAALFGHACFEPGMAKNTYGTGSFILMNTGQNAIASRNGLLTTVAWSLDKEVTYCLEGSIFIAGAAIQWLRDGLELLMSSDESESIALGVPDNGGVYFVPAFVGLGAPYWDMRARGTIIGLTRGSSKAHIVRAALESMAYQTKDVIDCMKEDSGIILKELRVDGGASNNSLLLQFQSDILSTPVLKPKVIETTALGAAYLAGLAVGYWKDLKAIQDHWDLDREYIPTMNSSERERLYRDWHRAVERARDWIAEEETTDR